jgi:hypothetical protein
MVRLFKLVRTTAFLVVLCVSLATTAVSLGVWAVSLTAQVTTMTASAAAAAIAHRKAIAAAVLRTKAKARLRRALVVVPVAGIAAAIAFEREDYLEWKQDNPDGDLEAYGCEVSAVSAEVVDDVLQDLPEQVRPSRDWLLSRLPECAAAPAAEEQSARFQHACHSCRRAARSGHWRARHADLPDHQSFVFDDRSCRLAVRPARPSATSTPAS